LASASDFEGIGLLNPLFSLLSFLQTGVTFALFEGTLSSERINLGLTVSSLLLKLSQSLDLLFLFSLETALFSETGFLLLNSSPVVTDNFHLLTFFFVNFFLFRVQGKLVGHLHLSEHLLVL
jgi:hypothetical protein